MLPDVVGVAVELEDGLDVNDWAEMRRIRRRNWSPATSRYETLPVHKAMTFCRQGNDWLFGSQQYPRHPGF